jgi:hypothetical protein
MRAFHLRFFVDRPYPDGIDELFETADEELSWVPETAGAYVIGATQGTMLTYPWGASPIYYIGESRGLRKSFSEYRKLILAAQKDRGEQTWWPRYQYGASFGATVAWYSVRGGQFPNKLQYDLLSTFYVLYGALPLGNGTWPSGLRPVQGRQDD